VLCRPPFFYACLIISCQRDDLENDPPTDLQIYIYKNANFDFGFSRKDCAAPAQIAFLKCPSGPQFTLVVIHRYMHFDSKCRMGLFPLHILFK